jgi:hypothetical protein
MRGSIYTPKDHQRAIRTLAIYCSDLEPGGELPPILDKDLIGQALEALHVRRVGSSNDRRYQLPIDYLRRVELLGLDPISFKVVDEEQFNVTAVSLDQKRRRRYLEKDHKRREREAAKLQQGGFGYPWKQASG